MVGRETSSVYLLESGGKNGDGTAAATPPPPLGAGASSQEQVQPRGIAGLFPPPPLGHKQVVNFSCLFSAC